MVASLPDLKKPEKTISAKTVNTCLERTSALFEWAKVRGIITYTLYGKRYEVDKLDEVIQMISYPGLNIRPWKVTN
jgi:hypothetical protein